jgi:uncharacterized protein (DUF1501 family)
MFSRRDFAKSIFRTSLATFGSPLWMHQLSANAFAETPTTGGYKAIVVVSMPGGNDTNNLLIPMDTVEYGEYNALRSSVAIPQSQCNVLSGLINNVSYGMHPSLINVSQLYNQRKAIVVANVGPLKSPITKAQLTINPALEPEALLSHPAGAAQWESATTLALPPTGWGGRIADLMSQQSGLLPPIMNAGSPASIFTVGNSVQGIVLQAQTYNYVSLPVGIDAAMLAIAQVDSNSQNNIIAQAAKLRTTAIQQQQLVAQAQSAGGTLQTVFPTTNFGQELQAIASVMNGRSVVGASRQMFYCQQGLGTYDTHASQLSTHASALTEFDGGIGAFMQALEEMGLANQVLVCTHSDFNRTMTSNSSGGTDHGWGSHQLIIGSGISGGQVIGTLPELAIGGPTDLNGYGIWIPTLSATQMTAAIGKWMGLTNAQLATVFPDLANFPSGAITIS